MEEIYFDRSKWLEEIAKGNELAFQKFFNAYYPKLLHFSFVILKDNEIAKDVVLEVFEKVWEKRTQLLSVENIDKYLFVLIKNKSIDQLRKLKELIMVDDDEAPVVEMIQSRSPEHELIDKELYDQLNKVILGLPEKCRLVYRLIKEDGMSYKEVAELLNVSPKTIDNHVNIAMQKIRKEILSYLNEKEKGSYSVWRVVKSFLL